MDIPTEPTYVVCRLSENGYFENSLALEADQIASLLEMREIVKKLVWTFDHAAAVPDSQRKVCQLLDSLKKRLRQ